MNMEEQRYKDALEKARVRYNEIKGTSSSEEKFLLDVFPDLVESDDERIRKELIDAVQGLWDNDALPMPLSVRRKDEWLSWLVRQGEQNHVDKVMSKFHEGDWIVFNGLALYVNEIVDGFYRTISKGGITNSYDWNIDNDARLWSISDARTGDVLAFKNNLCGIIICKSPTNYDTRSYCRLVNDNFISNEESGWDSKLLVPATKQQRDLLFEKMREAGYTWDIIKGLKKMEFNPDELIAECYQQQADDLIDVVTKTTWKPTKEQLDAFTHFVRSVCESGNASPYDNNTKQLYSLLNDLKELS